MKAANFEAVQYPLARLSPYVRERLIASRRQVNAANVEGPVRLAATAKDVMIVVAGGVGVKAAYLPTWSGGTRAVSRKFPERSINRRYTQMNADKNIESP